MSAMGVPTHEETLHQCRGCLRIGALTEFYNLFEDWPPPWDDMESIIANDLAEIAKIQITKQDKHTDLICINCCENLYKAYHFISTVKNSDNTLKERLIVPDHVDSTWPKPIQLDKNVNGTVLNPTEVEIKQEVLSGDEYEDLNSVDGMGYHPDMDFDIKVEPEEIVKPMPIQITVNGTISMDEMNSNTQVTNGCEVYENEEGISQQYLEGSLKEELVSEEEEQVSDLPLECMLCCKKLHSISGLKAHVIAQHSYKTVRRKVKGDKSPQKNFNKHVCKTCQRSFLTSTDLMVHETCHNKLMCYDCHEKFDAFDLLVKHRKKCKIIRSKEVQKPKLLEDVMRPYPVETADETLKPETKREIFKCSLCSEEFTEIYYLNIHNEIHHSKSQNKNELDVKNPQKDTASIRMETEALKTMFEDESDSVRYSPKIDKIKKGCDKNIKESNEFDSDHIEDEVPVKVGKNCGNEKKCGQINSEEVNKNSVWVKNSEQLLKTA